MKLPCRSLAPSRIGSQLSEGRSSKPCYLDLNLNLDSSCTSKMQLHAVIVGVSKSRPRHIEARSWGFLHIWVLDSPINDPRLCTKPTDLHELHRCSYSKSMILSKYPDNQRYHSVSTSRVNFVYLLYSFMSSTTTSLCTDGTLYDYFAFLYEDEEAFEATIAIMAILASLEHIRVDKGIDRSSFAGLEAFSASGNLRFAKPRVTVRNNLVYGK